MESEFSCEKDKPNALWSGDGQTAHKVKDSSVSALLRYTFWYTYPLIQANSNHYLNYDCEWLLFMCIFGLKNGILKSNIYVVPRPFQFPDMLQIYHGTFRNGNRNSTSPKHISCWLRHRWLISRHVFMDYQLKFPRIQMDQSLCQKMASKHFQSHFM